MSEPTPEQGMVAVPAPEGDDPAAASVAPDEAGLAMVMTGHRHFRH